MTTVDHMNTRSRIGGSLAPTTSRRSRHGHALASDRAPQAKPINFRRAKNRVLLVSGDHTVREAVGDVLRSDGFEVLSAGNGLSAVDLFVANVVNAIVLDHRTPFDAADAVGGTASTLEALAEIDPFLPLILMQVPEAGPDHEYSLMADMILTVPVLPSALLESIDALLMEPFTERVYRKSQELAMCR